MKTQFKLLMCLGLLLATYIGYSQCNSAFSANNYGGGVVYLQSTAYIDTGLVTQRYYLWNFGDGSTDSTSVSYDQHTYTTSGNFNVCLTVVDPSASCSNQTCNLVPVDLCTDGIHINSQLIGFGYDTFNTNLPGSGFTLVWNFGDGAAPAPGLNTSHQYTANGNDNVCVAISGPGCIDTICQQTYVNICQSYNPDFTFNLVSSHPYIGVFLPTLPNPSNYTYSWLFPSNAWANGDTLFYPLGSNTSVTMLVTSPGGCVDSVTKIFNLDWCGLQPSATESSNGYQAWFSATVADTTLPGTTYNWVTPGSNVDSVSSAYASVTYPAYGAYSAYVVIAAQNGCTDTLGEQVNITAGVYSIDGYINAGTANGNATVYLVIQDSVGHLSLADSTIISFIDTGSYNQVYYSFNGLAANTYYVKAALDSPNTGYASYLPTYYTSSLSWSTATAVVLTTTNVDGIDITLTPGTNPGGPGFVSGYVSQGAGLVLQPGGGNVTRGVGDALAGVQINLLTSADEAVAYTYTDANGQYQFKNLAYGSYKINAEQLNKKPVPLPFTLSQSDSSITNLNLSINSDSSYATAITEVNGISIQGIYPNPVADKLQIQLSSTQQADATVKMIDILGNTIMANTTKLNTGTNHLQVDMQNLAAGVYQLLIQTNNQHLTYKVVKAK